MQEYDEINSLYYNPICLAISRIGVILKTIQMTYRLTMGHLSERTLIVRFHFPLSMQVRSGFMLLFPVSGIE